jgi:lipopolysaccharide export system permease protein
MLIPLDGDRRPVLRLDNGHRLKLDRWPSLDGKAEIPQATVVEFATTDTPLGRVSDSIFRPRGEDERELTLPELYIQLDTPPKGSSRNSMLAELHKRIVNVVTFFMLPLLAVPFAIGRQRSQRGYRFGLAMVIVVAFHEIIEQGALTTRMSGISPWITMWLAFGLITAFAIWRFYMTCFTLKPDRIGGVVDTFGAGIGRLWLPLARRIGWGTRS